MSRQSKINVDLFNFIIQKVEDKWDFEDIDHVMNELIKKKTSINAIVQVILKIIKHNREIPTKQIKSFQQFFQDLFINLKEQPLNDKTHHIYQYFINFFATIMQSYQNQQLKNYFLEVFIVLIVNYKFSNLSEQIQDLLLFFTQNLIQAKNKKNCIEGLRLTKIFYEQNDYNQDFEDILIKLICESEYKEIREKGLKILKIQPKNINQIIYRIKDKDADVRKSLMQNLLTNENASFKDIELNGFCYLIFYCQIMKKDFLEKHLSQFLFKDTLSQDQKIDRIFEIHQKFDLILVYQIEKLYGLVKNMFALIIQSLNTETVKLLINRVTQVIFKDKNFNSNSYTMNLHLFIQIIYFLNKKNSQQSQYLNFQSAPDEADYVELRDYIDEKMPTDVQIFQLIREIFQIQNFQLSKQIIMNYAIFSNLSNEVQEQLQEFLYNYIDNFQIKPFDFQNNINQINNHIDKQFGDYDDLERFIPRLNNMTFFENYFLRKDNFEFIPIIFEFDIFQMILRVIQFIYKDNEEQTSQEQLIFYIQNKIKSLMNDQENFQNIQFAIVLYQIFIFNLQAVTIEIFQQFYEIFKNLTLFVLQKMNNTNQILFYNLLLKAEGIIFCENITLMIKYGKALFMNQFSCNETNLIYYAIFSDFLLSHDLGEIKEEIQNQQQYQQTQYLDIEEQFEKFWERIWLEDNSHVKNIIIDCICKISFKRSQLFQLINKKIEDAFLILLLIWKSENQNDQNDIQELITKQTLTIFFNKMSTLKAKTNFNLMTSFLVLVEMIQIMMNKNFWFNQKYLQFDNAKKQFWNFIKKDIGMNFIKFSCLEYNNNLRKGYEFYTFNPQELLFLYFIKLNEDQALDLLNDLYPYMTFSSYLSLNKMIIIKNHLQKIELRLKKYKYLNHLYEDLQTKIEREIACDDQLEQQRLENQRNDDIQEIQASLDERLLLIQEMALTNFKNFRDYELIHPIQNQLILKNLLINYFIQQ